MPARKPLKVATFNINGVRGRLPQLLGHGARHVLSGSGRQNLAARAEGGPRVPRGTLRPNHRRWQSGRHRRRDNSQLPPI